MYNLYTHVCDVYTHLCDVHTHTRVCMYVYIVVGCRGPGISEVGMQVYGHLDSGLKLRSTEGLKVDISLQLTLGLAGERFGSFQASPKLPGHTRNLKS